MSDNLARKLPARPLAQPSPETKPVLDERKKIGDIIDLHEEALRKFESRLKQAEENGALVTMDSFSFQVEPSPTGFDSRGEYAVTRHNGRTELLIALNRLPFPHLSLEQAVMEIDLPSSISAFKLKDKLVDALNNQLTHFSRVRRAPLDNRLDRIVEKHSGTPRKKVLDAKEPDRFEQWKRMEDIDKRLSSQSENIVLNDVAREIVRALKG